MQVRAASVARYASAADHVEGAELKPWTSRTGVRTPGPPLEHSQGGALVDGDVAATALRPAVMVSIAAAPRMTTASTRPSRCGFMRYPAECRRPATARCSG